MGCLSLSPQNKSGEESAATPGQSTPHSAPSTPHSTHQQPLTTSQYPQQQAPSTYPPPQPPLTAPQQYPTHYPPPVTAIPQQSRTAPYSAIPSGGTPPLVPAPPIRPTTQTTLAPPVTTPLAYSTLNVNVSPMAPSHPIPPQPPGNTVPRTAAAGSYYVPPLPPGNIPPLQGASPGGMALQQRPYLGGNTGTNAYPPLQTYKPAFIGSGSGQAPRPNPPAGMLGVGGAVGRGAVSPTPPRGAHPLPRGRTPQHGYAGQTHHPTQSSSPGVRPAPAGTTSGSIGWPR